MNSKIKNTLLEGLLIGTLALNGCESVESSKAKLVTAKIMEIVPPQKNEDPWDIVAQKGTKPYALELNLLGKDKSKLEAKIRVGDSIRFKIQPGIYYLSEITTVYRPSPDGTTDNNIIYTK